jgi:hypothetical protein
MSYAIGTVFYGIPLTDEIKVAIAGYEDCDVFDLDESSFEDHFETLYNQGYSPAGYCGVRVARFHDTEDPQLISEFVKPFQTTPEQEAEAREKIAKLPAYVLEVARPAGLYLIWSSS